MTAPHLCQMISNERHVVSETQSRVPCSQVESLMPQHVFTNNILDNVHVGKDTNKNNDTAELLYTPYANPIYKHLQINPHLLQTFSSYT